MKTFARILGLVAVLTAAFAAPAFAALQVNVNEGNAQPLPIAIPDFNGQAGQNIASVVRADLERSGLFKPLDPKSFLDKISNINVPPAFAAVSFRECSAPAVDRPKAGPSVPARGDRNDVILYGCGAGSHAADRDCCRAQCR